MKAVILAAGQSSRLYPFAKDKHKSMIKIMGKPLLEYTVEELRKNGIKDLVMVVGSESSVEDYFSNGKKYGVNIEYVVQSEPLGMGNAILSARKYIDDDFLLLHSYHFDAVDFIKDLTKTQNNKSKITLLAKERKDTFSQGVLSVDKDRVLDVVEKPVKGKEPSKLCIVGIYLISKDFLNELQNTPVEQYQFEKALSAFAKKNIVKFIEIKSDTVSLKFPWDLIQVKNYLLKNIKRSISKNASVAKSAEIIGEVVIDECATIMEGVRIKGPCYIGKNVTVGNNTLLRDGVCIEEGCTVGAFMEMKNTLVMKGSKTHSGFIGDCVIGENVRIGAQFSTGNVRLDRKTVNVVVKGEKIDSGIKNLGVMIGSNVRVGIKSSTMPGVIIGENSIIGPLTVVLNNVAEGTKYYTKFAEIVNKI
ncbi:MAG: NDP-sugar synthase [Patescibacteria group bacterium]|nr:NDP-sugar synthase [Patescibacteria group bacterium]